MNLDNTTWFTEICQESGSAFSLKIKRKLHEEQTPYQRIEIYETEQFGNLMTIDGFIMLTSRDNFIYHEMMSHPALFSHPNPKKVLIIGGGDCGTLREALKHSTVEHVDQIDIDEQVTRLSERYFPELCESNHDPRAQLLFIDGIQWVHEQADNSYDVIIIDSTDPIGPAEGLFSEAFYRQCQRLLGDNGIIIAQSESPLLHMKLLAQIHQALQNANFHEPRSLFFPQCSYPSGWWTATMASKNQSPSTFREQDALQKTFGTSYYNAAIHRAALAAPEFFYRQLKNQ